MWVHGRTGNLYGKGHARACLATLYRELCKMDERIEIPFGLWTRVGRRKHVLHGCAHWRYLGNTGTAKPIAMPSGVWILVGPMNHVLYGVQIGPCEGAIFRRKDMPEHARRHSVVSSAKMAERIEMPSWVFPTPQSFRLWSWEDPRKHVLGGGCILKQPGEYG